MELLEAFKVFDSDGSLVISIMELKSVMQDYLTEEELKEFISAADEDHDGQVKGEKFVKMMIKR